MTTPTEDKSEEVSRLKYKSNKFPMAIVVPWVILLLFCVIYLARYAWPDLMNDFGR